MMYTTRTKNAGKPKGPKKNTQKMPCKFVQYVEKEINMIEF